MEPTPPSAQLGELLNLTSPPIAISFLPNPPAGVERIATPAAAGCSYWKLAADGQVFYTEATDQYGCPIGAYTHNVPLPDDHQAELGGMLQMMDQLGYLRSEEVAAIPRRAEAFGVAVYAPLEAAPVPPDVVLLHGTPEQLMLLTEAAEAAGIGSASGLMGRPTCALLPLTIETGGTAASLGCIGNRVYTQLGSGELYFAVHGSQLGRLLEKLSAIIAANRALETFHAERAGAQTVTPG